MAPQRAARLHPVSWGTYSVLVDELSYLIGLKDRDFKYVYGIPRGGLVLAVVLSHRLRKPLASSLALQDSIWDALVVDDIVDSGQTMRLYIEEGYFTASLFLREGCLVKPTVHVQEVEKGKWVLFPYETTESTYG